jgi:phosphatidylserine synthase
MLAIRSGMTSWTRQWTADRGGHKPSDVEEPIDFYWHRPLAGVLVRWLAETSATPNQVTLSSGLFGFLAGASLVMAAYVHPLWLLVAGSCLLFSAVLDCADGQLARIKKMSSVIGRALDGMMDTVAPTAVFIGMVAFMLAQQQPGPLVWGAASVAAISLLWHAVQYDVSKNVYLHCSQPNFSLGGATLLTPADMSVMREDYQAQGKQMHVWLLHVWESWTKAQMDQIRPWLHSGHTPQTDDERALYVETMGPLMRMTSWLGFGFHMFALALSLLAAAFVPDAIWLGMLFITGPLNAVAIYVAIMRPRQERRFVARLQTSRANAAV